MSFMNTNFGFVRVAAAVPSMKVADCRYNAEQIRAQIDEAIAEGVAAHKIYNFANEEVWGED